MQNVTEQLDAHFAPKLFCFCYFFNNAHRFRVIIKELLSCIFLWRLGNKKVVAVLIHFLFICGKLKVARKHILFIIDVYVDSCQSNNCN